MNTHADFASLKRAVWFGVCVCAQTSCTQTNDTDDEFRILICGEKVGYVIHIYIWHSRSMWVCVALLSSVGDIFARTDDRKSGSDSEGLANYLFSLNKWNARPWNQFSKHLRYGQTRRRCIIVHIPLLPCGMRPGHIHKHSTHTMSRIINWPIKFSELLANNSIKFILDYTMHTSGWLHKTNSAYLANWCGEAVNATLELHLLSQCGCHLIITRASTTCSQDA